MISVAEILGAGLDYIRVDLYDIGGRVVFGELTPYPEAAYGRFDPEDLDRSFGDLWPGVDRLGRGGLARSGVRAFLY